MTGEELYNRLQKPAKKVKEPKPLKPRGKRTLEYEQWRDEVAKPYLDEHFGHVCSKPGCNKTTRLEVDHIQKRGSHPDLKMDLTNVRYLCHTHHLEVT